MEGSYPTALYKLGSQRMFGWLVVVIVIVLISN